MLTETQDANLLVHYLLDVKVHSNRWRIIFVFAQQGLAHSIDRLRGCWTTDHQLCGLTLKFSWRKRKMSKKKE